MNPKSIPKVSDLKADENTITSSINALKNSNPIVESLKNRYFDIVRKEKYPSTPEISKEADCIEEAIKAILATSNSKLKSKSKLKH